MRTKDKKNNMKKLIDKRFKLDSENTKYNELVKLKKERLEKLMGDLVEENEELEELIPFPICWR